MTLLAVDPARAQGFFGNFFGSASPIPRELVSFPGRYPPGTIVISTSERRLYLVLPNGQALNCFDASGVCAGPGTSNFWPTGGQQWYTASSGTSHSTPGIAGGAALVRQYFINQGRNPPSAAMTKAYLMNSARYMTGSGANDNLWSNNQGMGLMDLGMAFDGASRLMDDQTPANLLTATGALGLLAFVVCVDLALGGSDQVHEVLDRILGHALAAHPIQREPEVLRETGSLARRERLAQVPAEVT